MQKQYRLTKDTDYQRVRREGWRRAHPLLVLYRWHGASDVARVGISVSGKCGKAVVRNRIKRLLREVVRVRHPFLPSGWDLLFIARAPIRAASFRQVEGAVDCLLRQEDLLAEGPGDTREVKP